MVVMHIVEKCLISLFDFNVLQTFPVCILFYLDRYITKLQKSWAITINLSVGAGIIM